MENGDITKYLRSNPAGINRLTLSTTATQVIDVALGLEHLHSLKLVHGDLKAINVLVTRSGRAVLADFGVSSIMMDSQIPALSSTVSSRAGGTMRWQAPEVLRGGRNSAASDVYAFACVCYEIFTEKVPFFEVADYAIPWQVGQGGRFPQKLPTISDDVWPLMEDCWATEPANRPTANQIVARLSAPPIGTVAANTASDWEPGYTSKFRSSFQEHTLFHFM
ncbi:kinase-like domain-containing protein [Mycena polygramma]|nr:kinase-like domain-containing protein [Mycena polygramma]